MKNHILFLLTLSFFILQLILIVKEWNNISTRMLIPTIIVTIFWGIVAYIQFICIVDEMIKKEVKK